MEEITPFLSLRGQALHHSSYSHPVGKGFSSELERDLSQRADDHNPEELQREAK